MTCLNPRRMTTLLLSAFCVLAFLAPHTSQAQIKYIYALDYPLAQKASYLEWVNSVTPTLQAPEEIRSIASYDNFFGVSPHRFIEFEFEDMGQAAAYFARPEIHLVLEHVVNHGENGGLVILQHRTDYTAADTQSLGAIKYVYRVDYPLGRKDDYLEWVQSIAGSLESPPEVQRITSYDNYFGTSPHRYIEFEFPDMKSAAGYFVRPEVSAVLEDLVNHGVNTSITVLKLSGDSMPGSQE